MPRSLVLQVGCVACLCLLSAGTSHAKAPNVFKFSKLWLTNPAARQHYAQKRRELRIGAQLRSAAWAGAATTAGGGNAWLGAHGVAEALRSGNPVAAILPAAYFTFSMVPTVLGADQMVRDLKHARGDVLKAREATYEAFSAR